MPPQLMKHLKVIYVSKLVINMTHHYYCHCCSYEISLFSTSFNSPKCHVRKECKYKVIVHPRRWMTTKEWLMNNYVMIPYPRHTGVDEVDDLRWTENDYVVGSSTEFIVESIVWLQNDNHVRHVTTSEPDMRRSRLISCLGQVVIDIMVGMDKDSSSVNALGHIFLHLWHHISNRRTSSCIFFQTPGC
jgi:hypothetical protein